MKTYLLLWNDNNKLQICPVNTRKEARIDKRRLKEIDKNFKPKIVRVNFGVACW